MLFELSYYGYNVPEPMMQSMSIGTILLRYNQLIKKVKEDRDLEEIYRQSMVCPLMGSSKKKRK